MWLTYTVCNIDIFITSLFETFISFAKHQTIANLPLGLPQRSSYTNSIIYFFSFRLKHKSITTDKHTYELNHAVIILEPMLKNLILSRLFNKHSNKNVTLPEQDIR